MSFEGESGYGPKDYDYLVGEIMIWLDNDEPMYRQMLEWAKNYKRKQKREVYDSVLGLKGMEILADQMIRMYKEHQPDIYEDITGGRFSRPDKEVLKQNLLERVLSAIEDGELD